MFNFNGVMQKLSPRFSSFSIAWVSTMSEKLCTAEVVCFFFLSCFLFHLLRLINRRVFFFFVLSLPLGSIFVFMAFGICNEMQSCSKSNTTQNLLFYHKDTEPFISYFHVLTSNTSFQYLSIHTQCLSLLVTVICYRDI